MISRRVVMFGIAALVGATGAARVNAQQAAQGKAGAHGCFGATAKGDLVAARHGFDAETLLETGKVLIELAEKLRHQPVVVEGDDHVGMIVGARRALAAGDRTDRQAVASAAGSFRRSPRSDPKKLFALAASMRTG